ncbi:MAG: hypothetical protein HY820_45415 [Acidobacteria bacterium]|nr:hypothetical protein [Acidobacteriota bacterium]
MIRRTRKRPALAQPLDSLHIRRKQVLSYTGNDSQLNDGKQPQMLQCYHIQGRKSPVALYPIPHTYTYKARWDKGLLTIY